MLNVSPDRSGDLVEAEHSVSRATDGLTLYMQSHFLAETLAKVRRDVGESLDYPGSHISCRLSGQ